MVLFGYIMNLRPVWAVREPVSKQTNRQKQEEKGLSWRDGEFGM